MPHNYKSSQRSSAIRMTSRIRRREALAGLLIGTASLWPWSGEGKKRRKRRGKKRTPPAKYARYLAACREWCGYRFTGKKARGCADKAKRGQGACYSGAERGLGYVCATELACPEDEECCAAHATDFTPVLAECCPSNGICIQTPGPAYVCQIVA